jgi:hypothetical protein
LAFVDGLWKYEFTLHVLLRTHLAIENELDKILSLLLEKPKLLNKLKLTFSQKATLVQAMSSLYPVPWDDIRKLNSLRNRLAHRLEDDSIVHDIDALICRVLRRHSYPPHELLNAPASASEDARRKLVQILGLRLFTEVTALRKIIIVSRGTA